MSNQAQPVSDQTGNTTKRPPLQLQQQLQRPDEAKRIEQQQAQSVAQ